MKHFLAGSLVLLAASSVSASGADAPQPSVRVQVKPRDKDSQDMTIVTTGPEGDARELRIEAQDGKVVVRGSADPSRPWLGVLLSDADEILQAGSGLATGERRWTVTAVAEDSPAEKADLRRGDVITASGGHDIRTDGPGMLAGMKPGDLVTFDVLRDGDPVKVQVRLAGHPGTVTFPDADGMGGLALAGDHLSGLEGLKALESLKALKMLPCPAGTAPEDCHSWSFMTDHSGPRLGVHVEPMGEQLARYFGVDPGKGLLVKEVVDGSAAERGGIEAGDIIVRVGDTEIHAAGDIAAALHEKSGGDVVTVDVLRRGKAMTMRVTLVEPEQHGMLDRGEIERAVELGIAEASKATCPAVQRAVDDALAAAREAAPSPEAQREIEMALREAHEAAQVDVAKAMREARVEVERAMREAGEEQASARAGEADHREAQEEMRAAEEEMRSAHEALGEQERSLAPEPVGQEF
jgi:membrane-associated protease RseP (regulator of RpoE activity)